MPTIEISSITEKWVSALAQPNSVDLENLGLRDKGVIKDILGAENEVWLGVPQVTNLRTILSDSEPGFDSSVMASTTDDFILLQFACSFRAAPSCEFVRATVQVHMQSTGSQVEGILAYDLFPVEIYLPVTYKRTLGIEPKIKLNFVKILQTEVSAFNYEHSKEYILYQPEITAFGKGTNEPGWDFNKNSSRAVMGVKDLFLVIRKPKLLPIDLSFDINNCKIRTLNFGVIPLPNVFIKGTSTSLVEQKYLLT